MSVAHDTKSQYVRYPFLDERFQQHKVSVTPFGSAKRSLMRVEYVLPPISVPVHKPSKSEEEFRQKHGVLQYFSCKMTYPYVLNNAAPPGQSTPGTSLPKDHFTAAPPEDDNAIEDEASGDDLAQEVAIEATHDAAPSLASLVAAAFTPPATAQQPNPYWQQPPPTFDPAPDLVNPRPDLKKDDWHPLLATSTAASLALQGAKKTPNDTNLARRSSNPGSPLARVATVAFNTSRMDHADLSADAPTEPSLTVKAAVLLSQALFSSNPSHTIPVNAATAANHPRAATVSDARFKQSSLVVKKVHANNNYQNRTFNDVNNICISPPPAFRTLNSETRHVLQSRGPKTRSHLEHELQKSHPVMAPPLRPPPPQQPRVEEPKDDEGEEEEGTQEAQDSAADVTTVQLHDINVTASPSPAAMPPPSSPKPKAFGGTEVRYNKLTGDFEIVVTGDDTNEEVVDEDESAEEIISEEEMFSLHALLGMDSKFNLWNRAVDVKCEQENRAVDPTYVPSPLEAVVGKRRVKIMTQSLVNIYDAGMRRPALQRYLCGQGQRNGSTLIITTPPSTSSFTSHLPEYLQLLNMHNPSASLLPTSGIGPTPPASFACLDEPCAYAFKDENLGALVTEKGGEIEEIMLEGEQWISEAVFHKIADYCPNLKLLNIAGCTQITSSTFVHIATGCRLLAFVDISGCVNISGEAVAEMLSKCTCLEGLCLSRLPTIDHGPTTFRTLHASPALRALDLSYCKTLTDASLVAIATYCNALEWLNISGCTSIGDIGIAAVGNHLAKLTVLIMKLCTQEKLTTSGLKALCNAPRNLQRLDVSGIVQLDDATLLQMLKQSSTLRSLSINGCTSISNESVRFLQVYCAGIQTLEMASCRNIALQTLMDLIHDVPCFRRLVVTNSCISRAEVTMLQEIRKSCHIIRMEPKPVRGIKLSAIKAPPPIEKPKPKAKADKGKKT